jgi:phytoene synthase
MGDVVRTTHEPLLGPVRLAWWRERLEEMDKGVPAPPEPRLQAAARELLPKGVSGADLSGLEGGWLRLFDPFPWDAATGEAIWFRGNLLFGLAARLIGKADERIQAAGGLWALVDVARGCSDAQSRAVLIGQARNFARGLGGTRFPPALRPLSMLAAVAMRDAKRGKPFAAEGTPARTAAMLRHRLTGQLPR